ncbi:T9SS type A sorting domain-containing protein [candidate division KSB1 bacterium]|nr:T9SS type A sorting domain-containing protein [candidate division KSB1 bacterium]NIS23903.1 T9SS type A sorting domain-containing protein [candidate division KSB1 bacterium]NIT70820.1 T9SS type A sorting domain-containing protein [candidate division KSB1 bacterium]NIU24552.1 T9SS type A sorting domain-containing protein [candidate division KSB1 bacterium]NIU94506.1 T9SS type A sorting domain-containing protein [candidate division KSB1 bacterium]
MQHMNQSLFTLLAGACILHLSLGTLHITPEARAQGAVEVIADSTYDLADWSTQVDTVFGASEIHEQRLTGGNPGAFRYMEHILPVPPGQNDLARVEVTHIFEEDAYLALDPIDHIDYSEDIRLLNLQWNQAFIVSYPAIRQSGRLYRATEFLSVIADTLWRSGSITGLTANDFIALDGSGDHPDFSDQGDFLFFGFWRISTRGATLPPIPPNQDLVYQHGSDNFTVTIHEAPPANQPPVARNDEYLYLDYFFNSSQALPVLENDSDPEGDPIRIFSVDEPAFGGTIVSFNDNTITYSVEEPLRLEPESDFFVYTITDEQGESAPAFVNIYFCVCPIECVSLFLTPPSNSASAKMAFTAAADDTLDVELFRQFRDEALLPTETGSRFVDLYYHNAREVMPLLIFDKPELGLQAMRALQMMQEPLRNLVQGDGNENISQTLVDSVSAFLDSLNAVVSDSLRDSLSVTLAGLGPLQELVGLPVAAAMEKALGDSVATHVESSDALNPEDFALRQNYPNPFNPTTTIVYHLAKAAEMELVIYNILGEKIRTLVREFQTAGEKSVAWDGRDDGGVPVTSGLYFVRFSAGDFQATKKMILMR